MEMTASSDPQLLLLSLAQTRVANVRVAQPKNSAVAEVSQAPRPEAITLEN
jgi:hypothetical protein